MADSTYPTGGQILYQGTYPTVGNYPTTQSSPNWTAWNNAWNIGFNRGTAPTDPFLLGGYNAGLNEFNKRNSSTQTSSTNNNPTSTQQSSGLDPHINPATGNWDDNYYASHQQSGTGSQGIDYGALDAIYSPTLQSLQASQDYLTNTQLPDTLAGIESSKANLLNSVNNSETAGNANITSQRSILDQNNQSAWEQAVQAYNALNQQKNARFGAGSSTGGAVGELASRSFAQSTGQNDVAHTNAISALAQKSADFTASLGTKRLEIEQAIADEKNQATQQFNQSLLQISQNRALTESARAQAKFGLLQEAQNQARQLESLKQTALINLDQFKAQHDYLIQQGLESANQNLYGTNTNPFNYPTQNNINNTPQVNSASQLLAGGFGANRQDPYNNIINPFSA